jgi:hypothetical protein
MDQEDRQLVVKEAANFVTEQLKCFPMAIQFLIMLGLISFRLMVILRHRKAFADLTDLVRRDEIDWWCSMKILPFSKVFRLIRSLAVFYFFEQDLVQAALDEYSIKNKCG